MRLITVFFGCFLAIRAVGFEILADTNLFAPKFDAVTALEEGPNDPGIVNLVGLILERSHYEGKSKPLNDAVSSKFLDQFLSALDPQHLYFTQSDVEEFEAYRYRLDNLIKDEGGSQPARTIFNRFRKRIDQQYDYVIHLLRNESFAFDTEERYLINRKDEPRPEDLESARRLWKQRLRYEFLQERLSLGQTEDVASIVRENLEAKTTAQLPEALKDKLGKDKIAEVTALAERLAHEGNSAAEAARAVREKLDEDNARHIVKVIARRYNRILRTINQYDNDDVLELYLTSLSHVYDPHSDYMGHAALENFAIAMNLSLTGIGALLRSEDGYCKIVSLTPNGPAEKSGELKPDDRIIEVAQGDEEAVDVVDEKLSRVVDLIRGPKESKVRLTVIPADAPDPSVRKEVVLVRDEIKLEDQEAKARVYDLPVEGGKTVRVGVIDLPSFYAKFNLGAGTQGAPAKSTTRDVAKLLDKLKEEKVEGIILDLSRNGGGSLEEAINLTGLFIKEGPVVQVKDPDDDIMVDEDPDPAIHYGGPLVVLTSRFSASASEILAGALQDYGRAVVVGDVSTHGKGTVQSLIELGPMLRQRRFSGDQDPGAIKITIRKFYRASGASTQRDGVTPDIVLPSINNHAEVGEASLDNALPWDEIKPAEFEKLDWVTPLLGGLRQRSQDRVEENSDFDILRAEIGRYQKQKDEKSVSLNEAERLREKREADARIEARRAELAARPKPPGGIYEVTLKNANQPGLEPFKEEDPARRTAGLNERIRIEDDDLKPEDPDENLPTVEEYMDEVRLREVQRILADLIRLKHEDEPAVTSTTAAVDGSRPATPTATATDKN